MLNHNWKEPRGRPKAWWTSLRSLMSFILLILCLVFTVFILTELLLMLLNRGNSIATTDPRKVPSLTETCPPGQFWASSGAFCVDLKEMRHHNFLPRLCLGIESIMEPGSSVLDLGAGYGYLGRCLLRTKEYMLGTHGKNVEEVDFFIPMNNASVWEIPQRIGRYEAYDGSVNIEAATSGFVKFGELSSPFQLNRKFDWVVCLEVAEHIPPEYEETFVNNILSHANVGVIISWANRLYSRTIQDVHVNPKENAEVIQLFQMRGWKWAPHLQKAVRMDLFHDRFERVYRDHLLVFVRGS